MELLGLIFFLVSLAVTSLICQRMFAAKGKRVKAAKIVPSPTWHEGVLTALEREVFTPTSELVAKAEAKAEREFYGPSVSQPFAPWGVVQPDLLSDEDKALIKQEWLSRATNSPSPVPSPRRPQIIPLDPEASTERPLEIRTVPQPSGIIHLDPKANTGRRGDKSKSHIPHRRSDGQYEKYLPGIGLIRADTPEYLERCELVVREDLDRQAGDFNRMVRKYDELQSLLAVISRLEVRGTSEKLAERKTGIQKELRQIRQELENSMGTRL